MLVPLSPFEDFIFLDLASAGLRESQMDHTVLCQVAATANSRHVDFACNGVEVVRRGEEHVKGQSDGLGVSDSVRLQHLFHQCEGHRNVPVDVGGHVSVGTSHALNTRVDFFHSLRLP